MSGAPTSARAARPAPRAPAAKQPIAVLMGGVSAEREVSLQSGAAAAEALEGAGVRIQLLDVGRDLKALVEALQALAPAVALNCLHGTGGEDGQVQAVLEWLRIPYTHSGVLASAAAMDKPHAKQIFAHHGLPLAEHCVLTDVRQLRRHPLPRPYVLKPCREGSSVDVHIIARGAPLPTQLLRANTGRASNGHKAHWMAEAYVPGRELSCAVLDGKALDVIEMVPQEGFYDYRAKYEAGAARHIVPARLPRAIAAAVKAHSETAHRALGCRGVTRVDFRYDDSPRGQGLVLLELNTQPGLTPLSLVPKIAAHHKMDFLRLLVWLMEDASCAR